jgi:hypothetical protein
MKPHVAVLFVLSVSCVAHRIDAASWDSPECRKAFLTGMMSGDGRLVGDAGLEGFWASEGRVEELYLVVAKLYAKDIGIDPKRIASGAWKGQVAESLRTQKGDSVSAAYVSGAYARWGTPTGFRLTGSGKAYEIARRISAMNEFTVQLVHRAGYPGGTTITVSDGGEASSKEFFSLMHQIEMDVQKGQNQLPEPASPAVTPAAGAAGAPSVAAAH